MHQRRAATEGRRHQRCAPARVFSVDVRSGRQQQLCGLEVPPERRRHERSRPLGIAGVDVGSMRKQRAQHRDTIRCRCGHQRRHFLLVGGGHVGARGHQRLDHSGVPRLRGQYQGRLAVLIGGDTRTRPDQRCHDIRMPIERGHAERRHVPVVRLVHRNLGRQGSTDVGHITEHRALKKPHRGFVRSLGRRRGRDSRLACGGALRERRSRR